MEQKLVNVFLMGKLGQLFGESWKLAVSSPREALKAIDINTKGKFFEYLRTTGAKKYYKIATQSKENLLSKDEYYNKTGSSDIYIMPTIKGKKAVLQIVLGVVLVVVGIYTENPNLVMMGASLILGGILQALAPQPANTTEVEQKRSYIFQGNATTISQGTPIPIIYGTALVSPMPISLSVTNNDVTTMNNGRIGSVYSNTLSNGTIQYSMGGTSSIG